MPVLLFDTLDPPSNFLKLIPLFPGYIGSLASLRGASLRQRISLLTIGCSWIVVVTRLKALVAFV